MSLLVLKLALTPALIAAVTLVQRRWGAAVGGLLVGLPLTSGPVALYLALDHGERFAAASARGTIAGLASEAAFCVAYGRVAARASWPAATAAACAAFVAGTAVLRPVPDALLPSYAGVLAVLAAARPALGRAEPSGAARGRAEAVARPALGDPEPPPTAAAAPIAPWWDLPGRAATATAFVLALTAVAHALGPRLSGLVSPFPVYAGVLAAFTHHVQGPAAARRFLRGVLTGLVAFATFFLVLAATLAAHCLAAAFAEAAAAALAVQAGALALSGRAAQPTLRE
jgi:hypothetical protein